LWSLTDHLGTIRDIIGSENTHLIYDAFGNLISGTNPLLFGYTGKAFDTDTQLQNNINRWYDATIGRWLSTDPIGFEGNDTNLYRYVSNSSLIKSDSFGLEECYINIFIGHYGQEAIERFIQANKGKENHYYTILSCYSELYRNDIPLEQRIPDSPIFPENKILDFSHAFPARNSIINSAKDLANRLCRNYKRSCQNKPPVSRNSRLATNCSRIIIQIYYDKDAEELYTTGCINGDRYHPEQRSRLIQVIEVTCLPGKGYNNIKDFFH